MPLGYSFQPNDQRDPEQQKRLGQFSPGVQNAVKVLSLRLPNVLGGHPISPDELLRSIPAGNGPSSVVASLLKSAGASPSAGVPAPPSASPLDFGAGLSVLGNPFGVSAPPSESQSLASTAQATDSDPGVTIRPGGDPTVKGKVNDPGPTPPPPGPPTVGGGGSSGFTPDDPLLNALDEIFRRRDGGGGGIQA